MVLLQRDRYPITLLPHPVVLYLPTPTPINVLLFKLPLDALISILEVPSLEAKVDIGDEVPVIDFIEKLQVPIKSAVGIIFNEPVVFVVGPVVPVDLIPDNCDPPKLSVIDPVTGKFPDPVTM